MGDACYIGRFAPTPSGPLHYGSLVTAVASYCHARSMQGLWLLRIEDIDKPRVVKGASDDILRTLEAFGFEWDDAVLYQSQRFDAYEYVIQELIQNDSLYRCECSRKSLQNKHLDYGPLGMIYPGYCRNKKLTNRHASLRLDVRTAGIQQFTDDVFGPFSLDISNQVGDVVLKRVDGVYAYHLAVVVDDIFQGVSHIVRGADLLEVTNLHLFIYQLLDNMPPGYLHVPLATNPEGKKLSKQTGAKALNTEKPGEQLLAALEFLGQGFDRGMASASPAQILQQACNNWDSKRIPRLAEHSKASVE